MKKLTFIITMSLVVLSGAFSKESFAKTREEEAKELVEGLVSNNLTMLSIPKKKTKFNFYTLCDSYGAQFIAGYEGGKCVALSIDPKGKIVYLPIKIRSIKLGISASATAHLDSLHRIKGVSSFDDITGAYVFMNSGVGIGGGGQVNYFTKKIGWNTIGNTTEGDASAGGVDFNYLSLGVLWYTKKSYSKFQILQLDKNQIDHILSK